MSNIHVALPAPASNGAGDAVDVSSFGAEKTITVAGNGSAFEPFITIEISNQETPTKWAPLWTFSSPGKKSLAVAAIWMRAVVSNYRTGSAQTVRVGSKFKAVSRLSLIAPEGNGAGDGVNSAAMPLLKTIQVCGPFRGALHVDSSQDGSTYSHVATFYSPGAKTFQAVTGFMRVSRNGVPKVNAGLPTVEITAVDSVTVAGGDNYQVVHYTAKGGEVDFMVKIPSPQADNTYGLLWAPAGMASVTTSLDMPRADRTATEFRVKCTALTAGDQLTFMVFAS